jgi:hypothetical protein
MGDLSDSSQIQTYSNEKFDNTVCGHENINNSDDGISSITNEIIKVLQLNDNENKDQIVNSLLENGRQSLIDYRGDITPEIYTKAMDSTGCKLLELLKMYFQRTWEIQYGSSNEWFSLFLKQYQSGENHDLYERVLIRTAEYGNKYMKNCPMLSIVLQLLFEAIDDKCLQETNLFNDLWFTITNDGLNSITKYADYIIEDVMNEQINEKHSALFQALREYYHRQLFLLLQRSNIRDRQNLYDLALDSVVERGWLTGLQVIKKKTTPKSYEELLENIHSYQLHQQAQEGKTEHNNDHNIPLINIQLELTSTEKTTTHNDTLENKGIDYINIIFCAFKSKRLMLSVWEWFD